MSASSSASASAGSADSLAARCPPFPYSCPLPVTCRIGGRDVLPMGAPTRSHVPLEDPKAGALGLDHENLATILRERHGTAGLGWTRHDSRRASVHRMPAP